ncbi:head GIN domain-containing protein [Roseimarinus sediminis]|jgi:hypothetical protein|uniref:head GIN domain-containing protein n=1 Tax=Roseimarinus sediminis TaxID=1610899 RepID=UPI003D219211
MKQFKLYLSLAMVMILAFAGNANAWSKKVKGNGNVVKETREVGSFTTIKASAGVNVFLFQGDEEKVVVEADENLQECVVVRTRGDVLTCYIDCSILYSKKLNVYVNFKTLKRVDASSGADVYGETLIRAETLNLHSSSGADIKLEIDADEVECSSDSGADIVLKGKADRFDGNASSGADIKASDLEVDRCKASASSAGDISIRVHDEINANASSGGDVTYYGNPDREYISESSGGDVRKR